MSSLYLAALLGLLVATAAQNTSYTNPILPGYHSDPSCTFVPELNNTFFCCTSTFNSFPGLPVYASKDLVNWRLASSAFNRGEQIPGFNSVPSYTFGIFAPTIRYHNGTLYVLTFSAAAGIDGSALFATSDPYSNSAWSNATFVNTTGIDPDLFWTQNNDSLFIATQTNRFDPQPGIVGGYANLPSSNVTDTSRLWNGVNGSVAGDSPEGPHIYFKNGSYYLMIAEGGTERNHSETIARSLNLTGPYEAYTNNPIITARGTNNYFQSVGHCDLFEDGSSNWWAVCLSRRSGPQYEYYPMARETVLTPVTWQDGWPHLDPIFGNMTGPLPNADRNSTPGDGPFVDADDSYPTFTTIPPHFAYFGVANATSYSIDNGTLALSGIQNTNLPGLSFIGRRMTSSKFTFTVELNALMGISEGDQVGASIFVTPAQRIDIGLTSVNNSQYLYFAPLNFTTATSPAPIYQNYPDTSVTLQISAVNQTTLEFAASVNGSMQTIGSALTSLVSVDFIGSWLGVFANGDDSLQASFGNWSYINNGQIIDNYM